MIRSLSLAIAACATPALARSGVYEVESATTTQTGFGSWLSTTPDQDGDGVPEVLLCARFTPGGGLVQLRSGRTGALIRQFTGSGFDTLGWSAEDLGDLDGDGTRDVLARTQFEARVLSGATGAVIRAHGCRHASAVGDLDGDGAIDYGAYDLNASAIRSGATGGVLLPLPLYGVGSAIGVDDVTGDGVRDLALTWIVDVPFPGESHGRMSVVSGASGAEVFGVDTADGELLGLVTTCADLDADGRRDLAFAHQEQVSNSTARIVVHSSANGALLRTIANPQPSGFVTFPTQLGWRIADVGDVDLDGVGDLAATSNYPRALWVFSGATGARLMSVATPHTAPDYSLAVVGLPDLDNDGRAEIALGDPGDVTPSGKRGSLVVLRGTPDNTIGARGCFGDGTGTACPCGNTGGSGLGCANTAGAGARLTGYGTASIAEHDLWFQAHGLPGGSGGSTYLFFGTSAVNGGLGVANFAGLRCAGGSLRRTGQHSFKGGGIAAWVPDLVEPLYMTAGQTYHFQSMYRDVTSPCASANFTNLVSLTMAP